MTLQQSSLGDTLSVFPSELQVEINNALLQKALIPSGLVQKCLDSIGIEIGHFMIQLLPTAAHYARVPISGFHVGAVALGMPKDGGPGSLYLGSNMEFSGEALSFCIHGEQSATNNAWLNGEVGLQALAINAAPCGYCRQFLYELTTANKGFNIILKANKNPNDYSYIMNPLTYYLPDAFGPQDLGNQGGLMEPEAHGLKITGGDLAAQNALTAANASYSPYTKDYSGIALVDSTGAIYSGRYAENAAYNPSMSPMESALAFMNMSLQAQTPLTIIEAVLVETNVKISQKSASEDVLYSMAPNLKLNYFTAS